MKSLELNTYKHQCSFCAMIVADKLRVYKKIKTKQTHFFGACLPSLSDEGQKNKNILFKHILLWLYNLNNFLVLSYSSLFFFVYFVYSWGTYLKWRVSNATKIAIIFVFLSFLFFLIGIHSMQG